MWNTYPWIGKFFDIRRGGVNPTKIGLLKFCLSEGGVLLRGCLIAGQDSPYLNRDFAVHCIFKIDVRSNMKKANMHDAYRTSRVLQDPGREKF